MQRYNLKPAKADVASSLKIAISIIAILGTNVKQVISFHVVNLLQTWWKYISK